ncbi:hypothetical protein [Nonomuraea sp. NPDC050310]|uniref:hypothetical protein n=1 Tax=Nonomuraea sp. NPDC050310 TaxID=3154935 RepID=UPI00341055D6
MSDGYPTAAQKEALRLLCHHDGLDTERLAGTLAWRLEAQGFIAQAGDTWTATPAGAARRDR